jgi:hypothetical protein
MVIFHHDRVIVDNTHISFLMTARHICKPLHPKFPYIFFIISALNTKNKRLDVFMRVRAKNSWPQNVSGLIGLRIQSWESPPISNITFHIFVWIVTANQTPQKIGTSSRNWRLRTGYWNLQWWLQYSCSLIYTDVGGHVSVWWCVEHLSGRFLFHFICILN